MPRPDEKSRRLPYEWKGWRKSCKEVQGGREPEEKGSEGEHKGRARTPTTARYKRNVSDKLRDCCAYVGVLCAIAIRERALFLYPFAPSEDFQRSWRRGNIVDRIIPNVISRHALSRYSKCRARIEQRDRRERKGETFRLSSTRLRASWNERCDRE